RRGKPAGPAIRPPPDNRPSGAGRPRGGPLAPGRRCGESPGRRSIGPGARAVSPRAPDRRSRRGRQRPGREDQPPPMSYLVICTVALLASTLTFFSGFGLGKLLLPAFALFF